MSFEFNILTAAIAISWALVLPLDSLVTIVIAALVFFSQSIPVCVLFLLSLNLLSLIQAGLGGKKAFSGRTQKRYRVVFFGNLCALIGSTIPNSAFSYPLIFFGLLLVISNAASSALFYAHFESLSLKAFLQSVTIPSLVAINILLKVKAGVKTEYAQLWDITLLILGLSSFLISSLLALSKRRLKELLIHLSQTWIGLVLFLLVVDSGSLEWVSFAAVAVSAVASAMLLSVASKLGGRYFSFAKIVSLGFPGSAVFAAMYFALKITIGLNIVWLVVFGVGYMIQAIALIGARPNEVEPTTKIKLRFWLITATQLAAGVFLLWMDKGFMK